MKISFKTKFWTSVDIPESIKHIALELVQKGEIRNIEQLQHKFPGIHWFNHIRQSEYVSSPYEESFQTITVHDGGTIWDNGKPDPGVWELPEMPNGFTNWIETYHEVVTYMVNRLEWNHSTPVMDELISDQGSTALYDLAKMITNKFEKKNDGREWDGEFFE
jgi:hypothetical protein